MDDVFDDEDLELSSQEEQDIIQEALERSGRCQSVQRDERRQSLQDRRFYSIAGAMWEGDLQQQFANRPRMEINKVQLSVVRIINEYRANRIGVEFIPKDGSDTPSLIDACAGLYRADEQDGDAEEATDNAFEEGVGGGFGAWRLRTIYEDESDEENDKQRIIFEPITDADTCVFFDVDAKKQDKSDAKYCVVLVPMIRKDYEEQYEDDVDNWQLNLSSWPKFVTENYNDWTSIDVVYICTYYKVVEKSIQYSFYEGLDGTRQKFPTDEVDAEKKDELKSTGFKLKGKRNLKRRKIRRFVLTPGKIIENSGYIAGENIPVVPFYGKRWFVDNIERMAGHVRYSKDAQRVKNMQISALVNIAAKTGIEKPIFTPEQVLGQTERWEKDNIEDFPFLLINAIPSADGITPAAIGPQAYTKAPSVSQALALLLQESEQDLQDILGGQEAGEQLQSQQSGIATELIQAKLDMQTYIYMSNMEKAFKRCGQIWLSMAKDIYVEDGRKMKTKNRAGKDGSIVIGQTVAETNGGLPTKITLSDANFDCRAKAGPNTESKRSSIVRQFMGMLQFVQDPGTIQIIISEIMMNIEGEGMDDVRNYFRKKLLQMGVVTPTAEEQKELQQAASQPTQPSPHDLHMLALTAEAKSNAIKNVADTELIAARAELAKAQAAQALHGMKTDEIQNLLNTIDTLMSAQESQANAVSQHANAQQTQIEAQQTADNPPQPGAQ